MCEYKAKHLRLMVEISELSLEYSRLKAKESKERRLKNDTF